MKPLSATEAIAAIEAGTLTSERLVRDCLDRIAEREPAVKAWAFLDPALAIAQAKAADAAKGGLLRGIPVGIKDIIDTHDMPTGHNSPIFEGKVPFGDAACVALCRTANAVILMHHQIALGDLRRIRDELIGPAAAARRAGPRPVRPRQWPMAMSLSPSARRLAAR